MYGLAGFGLKVNERHPQLAPQVVLHVPQVHATAPPAVNEPTMNASAGESRKTTCSPARKLVSGPLQNSPWKMLVHQAIDAYEPSAVRITMSCVLALYAFPTA